MECIVMDEDKYAEELVHFLKGDIVASVRDAIKKLRYGYLTFYIDTNVGDFDKPSTDVTIKYTRPVLKDVAVSVHFVFSCLGEDRSTIELLDKNGRVNYFYADDSLSMLNFTDVLADAIFSRWVSKCANRFGPFKSSDNDEEKDNVVSYNYVLHKKPTASEIKKETSCRAITFCNDIETLIKSEEKGTFAYEVFNKLGGNENLAVSIRSIVTGDHNMRYDCVDHLDGTMTFYHRMGDGTVNYVEYDCVDKTIEFDGVVLGDIDLENPSDKGIAIIASALLKRKVD